MEVEENTTSNHLEESMTADTTIVINDTSLEITSSTDKESEINLSNLIPKSTTQGEEDSSVSVPRPEDLESFVPVAVGDKEEDGKADEVVVHCRNLEPVAALIGGIENSGVVESTIVVEHSMDGDEGGVKEIDVPSDDVAPVEGGGSELACSVNAGGREEEEVVVERNGDLEVVEEKVENSGEDTNVGLIEKDEDEGDEGAAKEEEVSKVLKDGEEEDVHNDAADAHVQFEDVENVQGMAGSHVKNDCGDVEDVQGDEPTTDERVVAEVVKEIETVVKEVVKEETVADEEDGADVREDLKEETLMANEETVDGVTENDGGETMVEDEEKSLDNEMETDKFLDTEVDTEKLDAEMETEKLSDTEVQTEKLDAEIETQKLSDTEVQTEKLDAEIGTEEFLDTEVETEKFDAEMEPEKSLDTEMETEEEANLAEEDTSLADEEKVQEAEFETEPELPELPKKGSGGKRKRGGKITKTTTKSSPAPRKTIEEDVCFICFDGGDLVLCDRRNCPKAYHPSCVNRDEAFFQSKGRWNCGWHMCSICEKKAEYLCYTCTYSLCKACIKTSVIFCIRDKEKKGLCEACMETVVSIENQENKGNVNVDDKNSWEHLFKDYWTDTKAKHNLSLAELAEAKNPWKGSGKQESPFAQFDVKDDSGFGSDNPSENRRARKNQRGGKKQKSASKEEDSTRAAVGSEGSVPDNTEWVSKELLEFVMHMRNGDGSVISQFDVQDLLLEYIKRNKLRDPNKKSQIICDARLEGLFGKPRVAHIEMLKLLESHFLIKDDEVQGTVANTDVSLIDDDETNETLAKDHKDKKRKGRKKGDRRGPQSNLDDYAAIDIHNITMIYLRRKLVEDLLDDMERFHERIVGTFVRIRISGANQKQDIYRLVQVTGTSEGAQYTLGKRTTCTKLEILNLDKTEIIPIDTISNQEFTEDECKRLRQSIKCGLISRLTVGDILDKAMQLQAARVNDWLETEVVRLSHLRDRASDLGRKKELRECVEKLNVLKTPEERARRLEEFPLIHDDPTMDPDYESEDDPDSDDKKQEIYKRSDSLRFNKRGRDQFSPRGDYTPKESWSGTPRSSGKNYDFSRTPLNRSFSTKVEGGTSSYETHTENSWDRDRDPPVILEKPTFTTNHVPSPKESPVVSEPVPKVNESEKMWHYKDPSGKIQGPFSMTQLRKWNNNGYFPVGLKIWRKSDKEDDGINLADALEGKFTVDQRKLSQDGRNPNPSSGINPAPGQSHLRNLTNAENPKPSPDRRIDSANLPSPTPNRSTASWSGGLSPTPNSARLSGSSVSTLSACGNKDANTAGSLGVSTYPTHEPSVNASVSVAPHNTEPGVVAGSQSSVPSSQLGQMVAPPDNNIPPQMVQPVSGQNSLCWNNAPPQNMQPNPSMNIGEMQQPGYNQWTGVPNMVQNPVGNFLPQPVAMPQEPWAQLPFPVVQPNMQPQPQPTNVNWATMAPDPNMGWVGPNPGNQMNWVPMVQGPPQVTGNVNPSWVMPGGPQPGWVPPPPVQGVMPNQNWVATSIPVPPVAGNGNPGWVGPPGNQVAPNPGWGPPTANQGPANTNPGWVGGPGNQGAPIPNQGWVPPPGNQGPPQPPPGNANQNWGSPTPRNHGNWGGNEQHHNRGNFSGQRRNNRGSGYRGNRRHFNKQDSFNRDGGSFRGGGSGDSARFSDQ